MTSPDWLPRSPSVPCDTPEQCDWRRCTDDPTWAECGTWGCGIQRPVLRPELTA